MLHGYFDDSGTAGQDSVVTLAGFITTGPKWTNFSDAWDVLLRKYNLPVFKMNKVSKWKPSRRRDAIVSEFASVITKHCQYKIECSLSIEDFKSVIKNKFHRKSVMARVLERNYFWVFNGLVAGVCHGVYHRQYRFFDLFFDEQLIEAENVRTFYEIVKGAAPPRYRRILPTEPIFRKDTEFRPLQAADLFAWITRRQHNRDANGWEWLSTELEQIESMQCKFLDKSQLLEYISDFFEHCLGSDPAFSEKQIERWSKLIHANK